MSSDGSKPTLVGPQDETTQKIELPGPNQKPPPSSEDIKKASNLFKEGVAARNARQLDRSIKLLTEAITLCPSDAVFYANRSLAYAYTENKFDLALQDAEQSLLIGASPIGYQAKGTALRCLKRYDEAVVELTKGLALIGNNADEEKSLKQDMAYTYGEQAVLAVTAKDCTRVIELATKAIEFDPQGLMYYAYRSFAVAELSNDYNQALQDADKSLSLGLSAIGYAAKGSVLRLLGRYDEALNELVKGLDMSEIGGREEDRNILKYEMSGIYSAQAYLLFEASQYKKALELSTKAIELYPMGQHYIVRSLAHASMRENPQYALEDAERALEIAVTDGGYYALGIAHSYMQQFDKALEALERGLALTPDNSMRTRITEQKALALYGKGLQVGNAGQYGQALELFSKAIELDPSVASFYTDRCMVYLRSGQDIQLALADAEASLKVEITAEGYRTKAMALAQLKRYEEARNVFDLGLLIAGTEHEREKLTSTKASCLPEGEASRWNNPRTISRDVLQITNEIVAKTPTRLFDTESTLLCSREDRLRVFLDSTEYKELVSKMASGEISEPEQVRKIVAKFFEFAMLSHRWEIGEPLLRHVKKYGYNTLASEGSERFQGMVKLKKFISIVASLGYRWAWSDTCCIDKSSSTELQKSIISMTVWYHRSTITIVYLSDVDNDSTESLSRSLWFKRGWTLQELLSPSAIRFYKSDWTPYVKGKDVPFNHKEHAPLIDLLHDITGIEKALLRHYTPNANNTREKLRWAASRQTTEEEDGAYSLMGVFNIQIPVMYGESQDKALGRLIQELLGYSSDLSILQWRGTSGSFNSCIPNDISAFKEKPFVPTIRASEMKGMETKLRHSVTRKAKARLGDMFAVPHSSPTFLHSRLIMSCIVHDLHSSTLTSDAVVVKGLKSFRVELNEGQPNAIDGECECILVRPLTVRLAAPLVKKSLFGRDIGEITEKLAQLQQSFYGLVLSRSKGGYYRRLSGVVVEVEDVVHYVEGMRIERLEIA